MLRISESGHRHWGSNDVVERAGDAGELGSALVLATHSWERWHK